MTVCLLRLGQSSTERNLFHWGAELWLPLDPRNLLDFVLELRLAKSQRFDDYSPNAEALPHGETRGEQRGGRHRRGKRK